MKFKFLSIGVLFSALTLSCSDNGQDLNSPDEITQDDSTKKLGYLAVKLNMTDNKSATRADYGYDYPKEDNDVSKAERNLFNFDILIFSSPKDKNSITPADEMNAKLVGVASSYNVNTANNTAYDLDSKTVWIALVDDAFGEEIYDKESGKIKPLEGNYYGYITANFLGDIKPGDTFGSLFNTSYSGSGYPYNGNLTDKIDNFSVTMTNAPVWQENSDPLHLTPIDLSTIEWFNKGTIVRPDMISKEAAKFYLQRNVAKLTSVCLKDEWGSDDGKIFRKNYIVKSKVNDQLVGNQINDGDVVQIVAWGVRNENKQSLIAQDTRGLHNLVQQVNSDYQKRFHSYRPADQESIDRVFWAKDHNYDNASASDFEHEYKELDINLHPFYFFENTMAPDQMLQDRSTSIMYLVNYYLDAVDKMKGYDNDLVLRYDAKPTYKPFIVFPGFKIAFNAESLVATVIDAEVALGFELTEEHLKLKEVTPEAYTGGYKKLSDLLEVTPPTDSSVKAADVIKIIEQYFEINPGDAVVADYRQPATPEKMMRYTAAIRHFNDDELGLTEPIEVYEGVDPYTIEHLGRYGVLRNNWYDVVIDYFSGPSWFQTDSDDPEIPDDRFKSDKTAALKCSINILSWAKRQQHAQF